MLVGLAEAFEHLSKHRDASSKNFSLENIEEATNGEEERDEVAGRAFSGEGRDRWRMLVTQCFLSLCVKACIL